MKSLLTVFALLFIVTAATAQSSPSEDALAKDMQAFREEVHARTGKEKEASLNAVKFGLACSEDFIKGTEKNSGKPVTESLKENNLTPDFFAGKVVEVCRNAAARAGIEKKYWDEAETRFLKKAILFSLIKDTQYHTKKQ